MPRDEPARGSREEGSNRARRQGYAAAGRIVRENNPIRDCVCNGSPRERGTRRSQNGWGGRGKRRRGHVLPQPFRDCIRVGRAEAAGPIIAGAGRIVVIVSNDNVVKRRRIPIGILVRRVQRRNGCVSEAGFAGYARSLVGNGDQRGPRRSSHAGSPVFRPRGSWENRKNRKHSNCRTRGRKRPA